MKNWAMQISFCFCIYFITDAAASELWRCNQDPTVWTNSWTPSPATSSPTLWTFDQPFCRCNHHHHHHFCHYCHFLYLQLNWMISPPPPLRRQEAHNHLTVLIFVSTYLPTYLHNLPGLGFLHLLSIWLKRKKKKII